MTERVVAYVDGFNMYFGLREAGYRRHYWLDVAALAQQLLIPGQVLVASHYFSARIRDNGRNAADRKRQNDYLEALAEQGIGCQFGHYLEKPKTCKACGATWKDYEEKKTDVNIALQLTLDAFDNAYDVALVVSGDSDLSPPIEVLRARFPGKRFVVAFPPKRHSNELKRVANGHLFVGEDALRASQLPNPVRKASGHELWRPAGWA